LEDGHKRRIQGEYAGHATYPSPEGEGTQALKRSGAKKTSLAAGVTDSQTHLPIRKEN